MPAPSSPPPADDADDAVRRLLASARHDEPIPTDVAARLDRVLEGLRSESAADAAADGADSVVSLDEARRRRRSLATRFLVAAAVVVIAGLGASRIFGDDGTDPSASVHHSPSVSTSPTTTPTIGPTTATGLSYADLADRLPLALRSDSLDADVRAAAALVQTLQPDLQSDQPVVLALRDGLAGWSCPGSVATYGDGVLLPATYDGSPAVLALRPGGGDGAPLRADVLACGSGDRLARTSVDPA